MRAECSYGFGEGESGYPEFHRETAYIHPKELS